MAKIAIASDHAGNVLRKHIVSWLAERSHEVVDMGPQEDGSVDYPDFAQQVARSVQGGSCDSGILICGSGMGMSIAANRFSGVRAALCREELSARMARLHNDANILVLGERFTGVSLAEAILEAWFAASFEGGRHQRRVSKIEQTEAS